MHRPQCEHVYEFMQTFVTTTLSQLNSKLKICTVKIKTKYPSHTQDWGWTLHKFYSMVEEKQLSKARGFALERTRSACGKGQLYDSMLN